MPIIQAIANIADPTVEKSLDGNTLNDAIAATAKPKSTKKQSKKDKRFTAEQAAAYYSAQSGKPLSVSSLRTNAKKYGFEIKERGSGMYALIDS